MPYKCPLGQLPQKRKYKPYNGDIIPETIRLPDGREIAVRDITDKITNRRHYNRLKIAKTVNGILNNYRKYTPEQRLWQSQQTVESLKQQYGLNSPQAYAMIRQAQEIIENLKRLDKSIVDNLQARP